MAPKGTQQSLAEAGAPPTPGLAAPRTPGAPPPAGAKSPAVVAPCAPDTAAAAFAAPPTPCEAFLFSAPKQVPSSTEASPNESRMRSAEVNEDCGDVDDMASSISQGSECKCAKCLQVVEVSELEGASRERYNMGRRGQLVCSCCALNYKALARRWKSNPKLKGWWQSKSDANKAAWYLEHKSVNPQCVSEGRQGKQAARISFDAVEQQLRKVGKESKRRRIWQPKEEWEKDQCILSVDFQRKTTDERNAEWNRALLSDVPKKKVDGQWCIGKFAGLIEDLLESDMTEVGLRRSAAASSRDGLVDLQDHGRNILEDAKERYDDMVDVLRPGSSSCDVPEDMVRGVVADTHSESNMIAQGFLQYMAEQAELRDDMEQLCLKEAMEAESMCSGDKNVGKTLTNFQVATLKSKISKAKLKMLTVVECDLSSAVELKEYAKELGECPKEFDSLCGEVINSVPKVRQSIEEKWTRLLDDFSKDSSSAGVSWPNMIQQVRKDCALISKPLNSSLTSLRTLISKHQRELEKQTSKLLPAGVAPLSEGAPPSVENMALNFVHTNVWDGNDGNTHELKKWSDERCAAKAALGETTATISQSEQHKTYMKWFNEKWTEKPKIIAAVDMPLGKVFSRALTMADEVGGVSLFEKKLFFKKDQVSWSKAMFEIQLAGYAAGNESTSAAPFGLAEGRFLLSGAMFVVGILMDTQHSYGEQVKRIKSLSGSDLGNLAKAEANFYFKMVSGDLALLPSGYIYIHYCLEEALCFRWGIFPRHADEHARVLRAASGIIDSHPSLNGGAYGMWVQHLMADERSHLAPVPAGAKDLVT